MYEYSIKDEKEEHVKESFVFLKNDKSRRKYLEILYRKKECEGKELIVESVLPESNIFLNAFYLSSIDSNIGNNKFVSVFGGCSICSLFEIFNQFYVCYEKIQKRRIIEKMSKGYIDRLRVDVIIPNEMKKECLTSSYRAISSSKKEEDYISIASMQKHKVIEIGKALNKYRLTYSQIVDDSVYQIMKTAFISLRNSSIILSLGKGLYHITGNVVEWEESVGIASLLVDIGKEYLSYILKKRKKSENGILNRVDRRILGEEFTQKLLRIIISGSIGLVGSLLIKEYTLGYTDSSLFTFSLMYTFNLICNGVYEKLFRKRIENSREIKNAIDKLKISTKILFKEKDENNSGYVNNSEVKSLLEKCNQDDINNILNYKDRIDWNSIWDCINYNEYQQLIEIKNNELEKNKQGKDYMNMNKFSSKKKEIYTLCSMLDIEGIELLLEDYKIEFPDNKNRNELICYTVEEVTEKMSKMVDRINEFNDLSKYQLRRLVADFDGSYKSNDNEAKLLEILKNLCQNN